MDRSTTPLKNWLMISWAPKVIPRVMTPALTMIPARSTPNAARMMVAPSTQMMSLPIILNSGMRELSMPLTSTASSRPFSIVVTMNR